MLPKNSKYVLDKQRLKNWFYWRQQGCGMGSGGQESHNIRGSRIPSRAPAYQCQNTFCLLWLNRIQTCGVLAILFLILFGWHSTVTASALESMAPTRTGLAFPYFLNTSVLMILAEIGWVVPWGAGANGCFRAADVWIIQSVYFNVHWADTASWATDSLERFRTKDILPHIAKHDRLFWGRGTKRHD